MLTSFCKIEATSRIVSRVKLGNICRRRTGMKRNINDSTYISAGAGHTETVEQHNVPLIHTPQTVLVALQQVLIQS